MNSTFRGVYNVDWALAQQNQTRSPFVGPRPNLPQ